MHMKPCGECPFARKIEPGALGGSSPETYVGQAVLPFWLPCHCDQNYKAKQSDVNQVAECAGAAIFRANVGVAPMLPASIFHLPEDKQLVFSSLAEFYAHHKQITLQEAEAFLTPKKVKDLALTEWTDAQVKLQLKARK